MMLGLYACLSLLLGFILRFLGVFLLSQRFVRFGCWGVRRCFVPIWVRLL